MEKIHLKDREKEENHEGSKKILGVHLRISCLAQRVLFLLSGWQTKICVFKAG